jgi:very-short-patch-repair endonuclease
VLAGLPEPQVGQPIYDADGGWLAQPDLSYPDLQIAIEYDGRHHLVDITQWQRDIRRRENLERAGWLVRVITAADLLRAPTTVIARISQDLRTRTHQSAA